MILIKTFIRFCNCITVKPILRGHLEINKTKVLMENGILMKVEIMEHSELLLTCIKRYSVMKPNFVFFLSGRLRQVLL